MANLSLVGLSKKLVILGALFFVAPQLSAQTPPSPADFIRSIADEAINTLTIAGIDKKTREERMLTFLDKYADIPGLAKFVVGRYWNRSTDQQKQEYVTIFRLYNAKNFAALLATYSGQKLDVIRTTKNQNSYIVVTVITGKTASDRLQIDWQLRLEQERYLITDFVVEGLSQAATLRDDFATILKGSNDLTKLIELLKQKVAAKTN